MRICKYIKIILIASNRCLGLFMTCVQVKSLELCLFVTLWTVACQVPLSKGFSRQEYWSGLPFPLPGALPHSWIGPSSLLSPVLAGEFFTVSATWEAHSCLK